jgi:hypothetical protein
MRAQDIVTLEGRDLDYLVRNLVAAATQGRRVRFTVDGGLKWAVGGETWTPPYGSVPPCDHRRHTGPDPLGNSTCLDCGDRWRLVTVPSPASVRPSP